MRPAASSATRIEALTNLEHTEFRWLPALALFLVLLSAPSGNAWAVEIPGERAPHFSPVGAPQGRAGVLPDFAGIQQVRARKLSFFKFLLPLVQLENQRLSETRRRLNYIHDHVRFRRDILSRDRLWLAMVAEEFGVGLPDPGDPAFWRLIRLRVDTVPEELVLVQAAMESAWGTSRFAQEGNNLFGQWCFSPGCGIVPQERPIGEVYEVASFNTVHESVVSYMRNLNTGRAYRDLREIREGMRLDGSRPDPAAIADGLTSYSERGPAYIEVIRSMLRKNAEVIDEAKSLLVDAGRRQERS
ncbi:MAG: glucosaminidase domain-containing protein [Gemmatimonadales bacterium]|nr:glucosaminidase domain-containing protein [Gemmatimonadales bacterium]